MALDLLLREITALKHQLDELRPIDAEREARILQKLRLDWNYHSNHLEGGKLTYGETKALILFGITAQGKPLQDHLEVSGHDEAIKWIEEVVKSERSLTEHFIRQLHELILKNPYQKDAVTSDGKAVKRWINIGEYKTVPNHVITKTGETFYFATPEETPAKMNDLMNWYQQQMSDADKHPILLAAEFHYKFIRIHPFDDGNGRMARLLMNFILMQKGYPPAVIKTEDKENYYAVLQQADAGILEPFITYIASNVSRSLDIMIKGAKGESIEEPDDLDKQIALLEHKLKTTGEKVEKTRSIEVIREWYKRDLLRLAARFIDYSAKFTRFYSEQKYSFISKGALGVTQSEELSFDVKLLESTNQLYFDSIVNKLVTRKSGIYSSGLSCNNQIFLFGKTNANAFNYKFQLNIKFDSIQYSLFGEHSKTIVTKSYSQILSDEEIDYVLKAEADKHLKFIQSKIDAQSK